MLLTVYLSIVLVSSLHIHPASLWQIDECEQCVNHTPHAGHLTASDGWSHDCLLCQFLSFSYVAAAVAIYYGIVIHVVTNPTFLSAYAMFNTGKLAIPLTILWIVGCTNAVNLIDGLDGLACGVSVISSLTMLAVALMVAEGNVAIILSALVGGCLGFLPYNLNPAKLFMGDTGSQLLGYVLATVSVMGMFKYYAIVTFVVPVLALAIPLSDTAFAFIRRLMKGQSPFHADRGHFHHRLLDMGLSQKQAVAILYSISAIIGLAAVVLASNWGILRVILAILAFAIALSLWIFVLRWNHDQGPSTREKDPDKEDSHE